MRVIIGSWAVRLYQRIRKHVGAEERGVITYEALGLLKLGLANPLSRHLQNPIMIPVTARLPLAKGLLPQISFGPRRGK